MEQMVNFPGQLDEWARRNGLSYFLNFCEAEGNYSVEIISACVQERYFSKRTYHFDQFKNHYEEKTGLKGMFS